MGMAMMARKSASSYNLLFRSLTTCIHHPSQMKPTSRFLCSSPEKEMASQSAPTVYEKRELSSPPPFSSSAPIPFWSKEFRLPSSPSLFEKEKPSSSFWSNNSSSPFYTKKQRKPASKSPLSRSKKDKAPTFWPQKKKVSAAPSAAPPPPQKSSPVTIAIKIKSFG